MCSNEDTLSLCFCLLFFILSGLAQRLPYQDGTVGQACLTDSVKERYPMPLKAILLMLLFVLAVPYAWAADEPDEGQQSAEAAAEQVDKDKNKPAEDGGEEEPECD
jgi:hypothetical protein